MAANEVLENEKKELEQDELEKLHPDYQQEIIKLIRSNCPPKIMRDKLSEYHESDIAETLELLSRDERTKLYHMLSTEELSDIFEYAEDLKKYFSEISTKKKIDILSNMESDTAAEYLEELDESERKILIDLMDDESKRDIELISSFDDDQIGSKMTTDYIVIKEDFSIKNAMKEVVRQASEIDNIQTVYVVDDDDTFSGAIYLTDLIRARENDKLESLIISSYPYVYAEEKIEDCIEELKKYQEDSIPVLDINNKIEGVITSSDLVEVVNEEFSEDYAKLAGLTSDEDLREPLLDSMRKRLPWLLVLLVLGMLVSSVVGVFEGIVANVAILMAFQSLILDMAGNVGTQSLAVTIRVLMDENISGREKFGLVFKEGRIGFINGLILGVLAFIFIGLYIFLFKHYAVHIAFIVSFCIGVALICSMTLSSVAGTVIPIFFNKIGMDPAVVSGPLITTINDLVAVVTYYGLSWLLLIEVLHIY